ncbi:MAG: radical SAM protein [Myxococcales bacterium]|nr:radical SAM protein [Myxococcales bacterium]
MPPTTVHLLGLLPEDLVAHMEAAGERCSLTEARQVLSRIISEGAADPTPRREPRRALVEAIRRQTTWERLEVLERVPDEEGKSVRYLFRSPDGALSEAVRIGLLKPDHYTVCLSSQVGCAMQCAFCATGRLGLTRNLAPWEIISAFLTVRDETPGRVNGAVFMGQGEPFHSYDAVIQTARILCNPAGGRVAKENITISTVGLVPQIRRYTRELQPYKLIISLTSTVAARRAELLPVAGRTPLAELVAAIREYATIAQDRVTVAWVVLGGVNTGDDEVEGLRAMLSDLPLRINLIDVNDGRSERDGGFRRATPAELSELLNRLQVLRVPVVRRYSVGQDKDSACGMLAGRRTASSVPSST